MGTRQGLGVVTPIKWVAVFALAVGTEFKACHSGIGTVIRQAVDQRVTRAALGAIDEGIAVTSFRRILHFVQTIATNEIIRRDMGVRLIICYAALNGKIM